MTPDAMGAGRPRPTPEPFDLTGLLPDGTALLEASAGTGKTYAIAGLAVRYVAEHGIELPQMLVVTFGRAATSEMRDRIRDRLALAAHALVHREPVDDPYVEWLGCTDLEEVDRRAHRLRRALSDFDAATIATTHQFCNQVLGGLGLTGGVDARETFAESSADLADEAIIDLYLRDVASDPARAAGLPFGTARAAATAALGDPHARLVPTTADPASAPGLRVWFATEVRAEVARRKRLRLEVDYDDLLIRVRDALADPVAGEAVAARLRARYSVVLVDEFQDTDPVQWEILRRAFHGHVPLVLIGDPKQAIYAFRGGDLRTYLDAATSASTQHTMTVNWRADPLLLRGVQRLLRGAALGDPLVAVHPVAAGLSGARVSGAAAPVRIRVITGEDGQHDRSGRRLLVAGARTAVARDVAAATADLLSLRYRYHGADGARALLPRDIAVLVRTNKQADMVREHLVATGIPAVLSGTRSVFATEAARQWVSLLRALEEPHRAGLARAAALTMLVGTSPTELAAMAEDGADRLGHTLHGWQGAWVARGVPALLEELVAAGLLERLLGTPDGERDLTDLRHVAEALHEVAVAERLGPIAQREWLARQVADADAEAGNVAELRSRRLESDSDAVQVLTVHSAKGLEFPVVLVPYGWDRHVWPKPDTLRLHHADGTRLLDVGGPDGPDYQANRELAESESSGEDLRAFYVAVTRAAGHLVLWWAPTTTTETSPAHRVLFGHFSAGEVPPPNADIPADTDVHRHLHALAAASDGLIGVERATPDARGHWAGSSSPVSMEGVARFERSLDVAWRRLSYTAITAGVPHTDDVGGVTSEPDESGITDEPASPTTAAPDTAGASAEEARLRSLASPWVGLPAGAGFGTLVHDALETLDCAATDLSSEVERACDAAVGRRLSTTTDPTRLAEALLTSLETPLGSLADHRRLRDIAPRDRLAELGFELPLAGGDQERRSRSTVADLASMLRDHLPAEDPLAGYPDLLAAEGLGDRSLGGYLVGSIDAVLRVRSASGEPSYLVVDYKTNLVGSDDEQLSAWHYRPDRLAPVMIDAHYPLQALLYCVALHRFLRWRQPGYDPQIHLGGVLYLFLRGMVGPDAVDGDGRPCGVFAWHPSAALVLEASDVLAGGMR